MYLKVNKLVKRTFFCFPYILRILSIALLLVESGLFAQNNQKLILLDGTKKPLIVPIRNIQSTYIDNSSKLPQIEYGDSYLAELSDQIVFQSLLKTFQSVELLTDSVDINKIYSAMTWAKDDGTIKVSDAFQTIVQEIAAKYAVDFVVIPGYCILKYRSVHQKNWREARSGSSYERPVSITAYAEYEIQFFQKDGALNRKSNGKAKSEKPIFYSYFKKKNLEKNLVQNSRKKYAPPLIRAMSKSIDNALNDF